MALEAERLSRLSLLLFFTFPFTPSQGQRSLEPSLTSIAGALFYAMIAPLYAHTGLMIAPDWMLGALFGAGGFLGMYCGARLQKVFFPQG